MHKECGISRGQPVFTQRGSGLPGKDSGESLFSQADQGSGEGDFGNWASHESLFTDGFHSLRKFQIHEFLTAHKAAVWNLLQTRRDRNT